MGFDSSRLFSGWFKVFSGTARANTQDVQLGMSRIDINGEWQVCLRSGVSGLQIWPCWVEEDSWSRWMHQSLRQLIMREETQLLDVRKIHRLDVVAVKARPTSPMDIYQKQCCHTNVLFFFRVVWYLVERCWNAASWRMLCKSWTCSSPIAIICIAVFWFCERFGTQATLAHYDPK